MINFGPLEIIPRVLQKILSEKFQAYCNYNYCPFQIKMTIFSPYSYLALVDEKNTFFPEKCIENHICIL